METGIAKQPFYVVSRIPGSRNSFEQWSQVLTNLCAAAKSETRGISYYWSRSLSSPDDIWGLEGFSHPDGFFIDHPSSDAFKSQMVIVDEKKLLADDYDVHHYHLAGGWVRSGDVDVEEDQAGDYLGARVAVIHFVLDDEETKDTAVGILTELAQRVKDGMKHLLSCAVLRETAGGKYVTLWIRATGPMEMDGFLTSEVYRAAVRNVSALGVTHIELHQSEAFRGHLDRTGQVSAG